MTDTANANCRELLDVLIAQGVETIVLSPGSRNTPLLIGSSSRPELKKLIITDERTAAFIALGVGIVTRRPVALACTSGTAMYNYAPAVAEAFYQKIPLVVITADRPAQWIDQDDSQTLKQFGALDKIVKRSYDIYSETGMTVACGNKSYASEREWYVNRTANEAMLTAKQGQPGPVHINMQFGNPLGDISQNNMSSVRKVEVMYNDSGLPLHRMRELAAELIDKKIMVVAGFMGADNQLNRAIHEFSELDNVTVLAETISNLHLGGHAYMVDAMLSKMTPEEKVQMKPDIVISVGGALVSRMLKEYLRGCECTQHWTLADTDVSVDCFQRLSMHIEVAPDRFFKGMSGMIRHIRTKRNCNTTSDYRHLWQKAREKAFQTNQSRLRAMPWSELKALNYVFSSIPKSWNLFLSNGTCIRYAQLLVDTLPHACYCNRGVSGIDGTNATAFGVALAYGGTTLLVTGDMSFAYCTEILNLHSLGGDLRIIVVNNRGGGIFRFIGTTRDLAIREEYFCCDPNIPLERVTHAYGWEYLHADSESGLRKGLKKLLSTQKCLLEIFVEPDTSAEELIKYLK